MLVVSGEAGIGKSALIDNVLRRDGIPAVLSTDAHELTQGMPFHPMAELLREARRQYAPAQVPMWAAPIATIVPELDAEHMHSRAPTAVAPAYDKDHLFEALRRYLVELTNRVAQLIIVIEDVQWADAATIDFLLYLAPRLPHSPLLVIVTCRPEARLEPLLAHDGRVDWLRRLPLAALDEPAVLALVISLTGEGAQSSRAFASRLYRATGGNPLFVDSTLRMLFERGDLWLGGDGQTQGLDELVTAPVWPVPKELQALLTRRTSTLTEAAQRVLRIAAVVEDAVEIDLLHALCTDHAAVEPLGEASLLDAVDELIAAELLDAAKDAALSFRHDVVREAVYAGLSAPRRQRLHLAVAAALEARREGDVPDRLTRASLVAEHFLRGRSWD
jgi:predicted ATPase